MYDHYLVEGRGVREDAPEPSVVYCAVQLALSLTKTTADVDAVLDEVLVHRDAPPRPIVKEMLLHLRSHSMSQCLKVGPHFDSRPTQPPRQLAGGRDRPANPVTCPDDGVWGWADSPLWWRSNVQRKEATRYAAELHTNLGNHYIFRHVRTLAMLVHDHKNRGEEGRWFQLRLKDPYTKCKVRNFMLALNRLEQRDAAPPLRQHQGQPCVARTVNGLMQHVAAPNSPNYHTSPSYLGEHFEQSLGPWGDLEWGLQTPSFSKQVRHKDYYKKWIWRAIYTSRQIQRTLDVMNQSDGRTEKDTDPKFYSVFPTVANVPGYFDLDKDALLGFLHRAADAAEREDAAGGASVRVQKLTQVLQCPREVGGTTVPYGRWRSLQRTGSFPDSFLVMNQCLLWNQLLKCVPKAYRKIIKFGKNRDAAEGELSRCGTIAMIQTDGWGVYVTYQRNKYKPPEGLNCVPPPICKDDALGYTKDGGVCLNDHGWNPDQENHLAENGVLLGIDPGRKSLLNVMAEKEIDRNLVGRPPRRKVDVEKGPDGNPTKKKWHRSHPSFHAKSKRRLYQVSAAHRQHALGWAKHRAINELAEERDRFGGYNNLVTRAGFDEEDWEEAVHDILGVADNDGGLGRTVKNWQPVAARGHAVNDTLTWKREAVMKARIVMSNLWGKHYMGARFRRQRFTRRVREQKWEDKMANDLEKRFEFPAVRGTADQQAEARESRRNIVMLWGDTGAIEGHKNQRCPMASTRLKNKMVHRGVHAVSVDEYLTTKICNWCMEKQLESGHGPQHHFLGQDYHFEMQHLPTKKQRRDLNLVHKGGWRENRKARKPGENPRFDKFSGLVWRLLRCKECKRCRHRDDNACRNIIRLGRQVLARDGRPGLLCAKVAQGGEGAP